eukprot:scaffold16271_cov132-Isochrysis_galbana.AAC.2
MVSAKPQLASGTGEAAAGPDELRLGSAARRGAIRCAGLRLHTPAPKKEPAATPSASPPVGHRPVLSLRAAQADVSSGWVARRSAARFNARGCAGLGGARVRHTRTWTKTKRTRSRRHRCRRPARRQACHCSFVIIIKKERRSCTEVPVQYLCRSAAGAGAPGTCVPVACATS